MEKVGLKHCVIPTKTGIENVSQCFPGYSSPRSFLTKGC